MFNIRRPMNSTLNKFILLIISIVGFIYINSSANASQSDADLIFHSGYIEGAKTFIGYIPSKEIGIIILSNDSSAFPVQSGIDFCGEIIKY